jgi:hypothetical protein
MKKQERVNSVPAPQKIGGKPIEAVIEPCRRPGLIRLTDKEPAVALQWYAASMLTFIRAGRRF